MNGISSVSPMKEAGFNFEAKITEALSGMIFRPDQHVSHTLGVVKRYSGPKDSLCTRATANKEGPDNRCEQCKELYRLAG